MRSLRENAMADTRVQLEVEDWVRREWMPKMFGQSFFGERVNLSSGGVFLFDAVSVDHKVVATISTSEATTATGKNAVGKQMKLRSDMYFLLLAKADKRAVVLTEKSMYDWWAKEAERGRVHRDIEFFYAMIPGDLDVRLRASRKRASMEVTPGEVDTSAASD